MYKREPISDSGQRKDESLKFSNGFSIKPAPPSCPVCPARLPLHQRTHPHWSDCWAPPVKIRSCYDHRPKYGNSVSTRFCILGRFDILYYYIHILLWCFPKQHPELREEQKVLNTVAAWWSGGAPRRWSNRNIRQSGMKLEKIKQDFQ